MGTSTADIMTAVLAVFNGLLNMINSILLPSGGLTPVSVFAWFGIVLAAATPAIGLLKKIINFGGSSGK